MNSYAGLSHDALRVLATLPSNAAAFSCLTASPLDNTTPDLTGPTDPPGYVRDDASRGSYLDTLDGHADNRYFYRTSYVDGANNGGPLGLSTPPVRLPPTALPDTPVLQKAVTGEETSIVLTFATSRSATVTSYHVYRSDDPARARDIHLMERVAVVNEAPLAQRPLTQMFTDNSAKGLITYSYRLVAVTDDGRTSEPSAALSARAVDEGLPSVPVLTAQWSSVNGETLATLTWTSQDETLLQERPAGTSSWRNLGPFLAPGAQSVRDPFSDPTADFQFRLVVRKYTGAVVRGQPVTLAKQ
jgi:hypothetical protein